MLKIKYNKNFQEINDDYTIISDTIVIHNTVKKPIDFNLIYDYGNSSKIIFSDYSDVNICVKCNNILNIGSYNTPSKFNHDVILTNKIKEIKFNLIFDRQINLLDTLTHLTFNDYFNQPIQLPSKLEKLKFGNDFNQQINIPPTLTHLTVGIYFKQFILLPCKLVYLNSQSIEDEYFIDTQNVVELTINSNNLKQINNLSNSLKKLTLDYNFKLPIDNLPNSIENLSILNSSYNHELNNLPLSIKYLQISLSYDKKILNMPKNLQLFKCSYYYKYANEYPDYMIELY